MHLQTTGTKLNLTVHLISSIRNFYSSGNLNSKAWLMNQLKHASDNFANPMKTKFC